MKPNNELAPDEVIKMPLKEFESRFGFRPVDAIEKHHFAASAKRLDRLTREMIEAGILGEFSVDHVVMDD